MTLTFLAAAASILIVIGLSMVLFRGRHSSEMAMRVVPLEYHAVHVLRTEEELRDAVQRAASFDRRAAQILQTRSTRYRELMSVSPPE